MESRSWLETLKVRAGSSDRGSGPWQPNRYAAGRGAETLMSSAPAPTLIPARRVMPRPVEAYWGSPSATASWLG